MNFGQFEISEQLRTRRDKADIVDALEKQLQKVCRKVERKGDTITAIAIQGPYGSFSRSDCSVFNVQPKDGGFLFVTDVTIRPSVVCWIGTILMCLMGPLVIAALVVYVIQKRTVRPAVADVLTRIKNEFGELSLA